jgi:hypothetical protein
MMKPTTPKISTWWGAPMDTWGTYGKPWPIKDSTRCYKGIYSPKGGKKQKKSINK